MSVSEAKRALSQYAIRVNRANKRLSPQLAALASTGSTLQMQTAKYKIFKANKLTISPYKYGSPLVASPKFTGHPKWFFAAMTDRGGNTPLRDIIVLVQDKPGGPWRSAYTPLTTAPATGPLARGVDVADFPEVAPQDDASLVLPPGGISGALADVLNLGSRSGHYRSLTLTPWIKTRYRNLREDKTVFKRNGWAGTASYSASTVPTYAVRTTSGGALVWSAIELKEAFRHTGRGNNITWNHDEWGDLLRPYIRVSTAKTSLTTIERLEVLAYVPPKGKGRVRFLANRWAPISIQGR
ncbi:hypothetical protein [Actinomadura sp. HBU206391]|uniref:hypothetical protein n=1 Tax=Actinomadura sp. HBU206391 TaxID=2731692 RepID=UPI00164F8B33|nr:hypothetical protein [Actinomadura sp. HBU206391]MBC6457924.1 hypothetical protein [Actinomadura sp. HBU206391]